MREGKKRIVEQSECTIKQQLSNFRSERSPVRRIWNRGRRAWKKRSGFGGTSKPGGNVCGSLTWKDTDRSRVQRDSSPAPSQKNLQFNAKIIPKLATNPRKFPHVPVIYDQIGFGFLFPRCRMDGK